MVPLPLKMVPLALASIILSSPSSQVIAFTTPRHHNTLPRGAIRKRRNSIRGTTGRLWSNRKDGNGDNNGNKDPNPGGMTDWGEEDNDERSSEDLNFIEQIQEWFTSPEGKEDIQTYAVSLGIALLLRFLIIEPRYIPSLSMFPTFEVGDQLAVEKVTKRIRPFSRREVVVFNPPEAFREYVGASSSKAKEALITRVIAIEGDKVEIMGGKLFVNGVEQDEPFTAEDAAYEFGPVIVPPGDVLVLGDNRNHSLDGHIWGFLPTENVIGRAVFVYWPPWRVGTTGMY